MVERVNTMKCLKCHTSNPEDAKFCHQCGNPIETIRDSRKSIVSERKHVSVLFSDVSGYTAMSEKLDPEEIVEIMSRIFKEASKVVTEMEGFIDKFIGDSILAVFGALQNHEDDAVRAIIAAQKIHNVVSTISSEIENHIGQPLSMHSGIASGLIVTGEMDVEAGKGGITGDTINLASRLEGLSKPGEILVGPKTYQESFRHFLFEDLGPQKVKGKTKSLHVFKVLAQREHPEFVNHKYGLRANFIGRQEEIDHLCKVFEQVKDGRTALVTICGSAGTGKSRLVEEFKNRVRLEEVQWLEGYAYAHRQQIPYGPVIDCLTHSFSIEENDSPRIVRRKLESGLKSILVDYKQTVPYIGSLFSIRYPEIEEVSPEFWKSQLQQSIETTLSGFASVRSTVLCLEDLHWADPSSIELLHFLIENINHLFFFSVYIDQSSACLKKSILKVLTSLISKYK
jgi:class 3 adenylate cyclase